MDLTAFFAGALLLTGLAYGGVEFFKWVFDLDPVTDKRWLALVVVAVCFTATFLVRYSPWAADQQIGDKRLDQLGIVACIIVAILLVFAEVATFFVVQLGARAVSNIGENQPTPIAEAVRLAKAQDVHANVSIDHPAVAGTTDDLSRFFPDEA